MIKGKQRFYLVLYIAATALIFLYVLFPDTAVKEYLANRVTHADPAYHMDIGSLSPSLPFALILKDVQLNRQEGWTAHASHLKMSPNWSSLFSSKRGLKFNGTAYQGLFNGIISSVKSKAGKYPSVNAEFAGLSLGELPWLQDQSDINISGALSGKVRYEQKSTTDRSGSVNADIVDCMVTLTKPLFDPGPLEFDEIKLVAVLNGNNVDIQQGTFKGEQLSGSLSGNIQIQTPVENSRLRVNIKVKPDRAFLSNLSGVLSALLPRGVQSGKDDLKLNITGTISKPRASME